jgi:hypothetical protein
MLDTVSNTPPPQHEAASSCASSPLSPLQPQEQQDELHSQVTASGLAAEALSDLLAGRVECVEFSGGRVFVDVPRGPGQVYLPGSFNPLHHGHQDMLAAAVQMSGDANHQGCFELTVLNADKVTGANGGFQRMVLANPPAHMASWSPACLSCAVLPPSTTGVVSALPCNHVALCLHGVVDDLLRGNWGRCCETSLQGHWQPLQVPNVRSVDTSCTCG